MRILRAKTIGEQMNRQNKDVGEYLFHQGTNYESYKLLGCHAKIKKKSYEYTFRTWAPNAFSVSVVGDFADWDSGIPMTRKSANGIWELVIESGVSLEKNKYKFKRSRKANK